MSNVTNGNIGVANGNIAVTSHNAVLSLVEMYGALLRQQATEHALVVAQLKARIAQLEARANPPAGEQP